MSRIAIIGGGISGLSLAYRLQQRLPASEIQVFERGHQVGGTIATIARDGFRVETGPNGFLDSNPAALDLCRDLGIDRDLITASDAARKNRFLLLDGKLRRLPSGLLSFLASPVLGWRSKLNLLLERFRAPRRDNADESIDAFVRRRVGAEVADTLADAFVTGIFAGDPRLLSVRAALPRLAGFEREHGSVQRGMSAARRQRRTEAATRGEPPPQPNRMWSFREGLGFLVEQLRLRLRHPPLTGVEVRDLRREGRCWVIRSQGQHRWEADVVALTCPAYQQAALLEDIDPSLAEQVAEIPYNRVAVVALGFRTTDMPKPLDGFGYLSPQRERRDILGVQWCSTIFPDRAPPGMVLLRAMSGGWRRPEIVDWDDEQLVKAVRGELAVSMGIRGDPVFHHIIRWDRAIPQYHLGHLERVASIDAKAASHEGLFLGGNAYRGVALSDCVEQADLLAKRIAGFVEKPP